MRKKVTVVGSGNVGATAAHWLASKEHADVVLIDIIEGVPQGKGLDLLQAMPIEKRDSYVLGTNDYADTANSDIVVITAGIPRKPGMSRDDLLNTNYKIMSDVVGKVVQYSPNCILIIVSNPLDAMAQAAYKLSGFSRNRVIGMAGILDSARFRAFIAARTGCLGGERYRVCAGRPRRHHGSAAALLDGRRNSDHRVDGQGHDRPPGAAHARRRRRDREASEDRQRLLRSSAAVAEMVEAILKDKKKIVPCAAYLEGEYGINGLFVGVPCKLGSNGIEKIIEIKLTPEEQAALQKSADSVKELVGVIGV